MHFFISLPMIKAVASPQFSKQYIKVITPYNNVKNIFFKCIINKQKKMTVQHLAYLNREYKLV